MNKTIVERICADIDTTVASVMNVSEHVGDLEAAEATPEEQATLEEVSEKLFDVLNGLFRIKHLLNPRKPQQ